MITLALAAAHGGTDRSNRSADGELVEADLVLRVAYQAAQLLALGDVVDPVLVRQGDEGLTHQERADIAGRAGVDAAVEIHFNSSGDPARHGAELYWHRGDHEGHALGRAIMLAIPGNRAWRSWCTDAMYQGEIANPNALRVTAAYRAVGVPCALVELGFLTSAADCFELSRPGAIDTLAQAVADGCAEWARSVTTAKP